MMSNDDGSSSFWIQASRTAAARFSSRLYRSERSPLHRIPLSARTLTLFVPRIESQIRFICTQIEDPDEFDDLQQVLFSDDIKRCLIRRNNSDRLFFSNMMRSIYFIININAPPPSSLCTLDRFIVLLPWSCASIALEVEVTPLVIGKSRTYNLIGSFRSYEVSQTSSVRLFGSLPTTAWPVHWQKDRCRPSALCDSLNMPIGFAVKSYP